MCSSLLEERRRDRALFGMLVLQLFAFQRSTVDSPCLFHPLFSAQPHSGLKINFLKKITRRPHGRQHRRDIGGFLPIRYRGHSKLRTLTAQRSYTRLRSIGPLYRGTSLIRKTPLLGPYRRTIPRVLWWSWGGSQIFQRSFLPPTLATNRPPGDIATVDSPL